MSAKQGHEEMVHSDVIAEVHYGHFDIYSDIQKPFHLFGYSGLKAKL